MSRFVIAGTFKASGTILVASIVQLDVANPRQVLQGAVGVPLFGVCQVGGGAFPVAGAAAAPAAVAGGAVEVYATGSTVLLQAGAAGYSAKDFLTSDATGLAATAKPGDYVIAQALETAQAGECREVVTLPPGTVLGLGGSVTLSIAANTALTPVQSKTKVFVTAADVVATLPPIATSKGATFQVYAAASTTALQAGAVGIKVALAAADVTAGAFMYGDGVTPTAGYGLCNTHGTAHQGDAAEFYCDGTAWWIFPVVGTWASHS